MGAVATFFLANVNQVIMDRRVSGDTIFACEAARHPMRGHRQQLSLGWVYSRRERYEGVAQAIDRFLVFRPSSAQANHENTNENDVGIHFKNLAALLITDHENIRLD